MSQSTDILKIKNLSTGYLHKKNQKIVSKHLNLSIQKGNFIALLGPNGCGKSTLLRTIVGLQKPLEGEVTINQIGVEDLKIKEKARLLSLVLTDPVGTAYLKVKDIVGMGRYPHLGGMGILSREDEQVLQDAMEQCQVQEYQGSFITDLSDGEKQRVMLARALAQDTVLMMLDEPTAHLDLPNRVALMKMLRELAHQNKKAILLSTHELDLALQWCDGICLMNEKGEIVKGAPEDLVLNGSFSDVFSSEELYFDISTASFKTQESKQGTCYIIGGAIYKKWTQRAIERIGFELTKVEDTADFVIEIKHDKTWVLKDNQQSLIAHSIGELIQLIKII